MDLDGRVPCRYQPRSIKTKVRAILSTSGFLDSTDEAPEDHLGIVLEATPFYAGTLLPMLHTLPVMLLKTRHVSMLESCALVICDLRIMP